MPSSLSSGSFSSNSGQYAPFSCRQPASPLDKIPCTKTTEVLPFGLLIHPLSIFCSIKIEVRSQCFQARRLHSPFPLIPAFEELLPRYLPRHTQGKSGLAVEERSPPRALTA